MLGAFRTPILLLLLAGTSDAASGSPGLLRNHCVLHAADPADPWALTHGLLGLGRDFPAADGRKAADVLVADFLQKGADPAASPYGFDRRLPDGGALEPFPNLHLRTLVVVGVPSSTRWKARFGEVTLKAWTLGAQRGFRHVPGSEGYWHDAAWTLEVLARTLSPSPSGARFRHGGGEEVDFHRVMDDALEHLERGTAELAAGKKAGLPEVPKRRQGIYAHPCGGLHHFGAVAAWARHPEVRRRWGARWTAQVELLFYRLGSESRQYEAALAAAPEHRLAVLGQMVKFYGHFLDSVGQLERDRTLRLGAEQRNAVLKARALLDHATRELQAQGVFENAEALARTQPELWRELLADACIAARGLSPGN